MNVSLSSTDISMTIQKYVKFNHTDIPFSEHPLFFNERLLGDNNS